MKITINEGLSWQKTLKTRHAELVKLRDTSAKRTMRAENPYDRTSPMQLVDEPTYDVVSLDKTIAGIARELRVLESAIKHMNGKTVLENYEQDDKVLGELV